MLWRVTILSDLNYYSAKYHQDWEDLKLDFVIGPVWPYPAPKSKDVPLTGVSSHHTIPHNVLDVPCGTIPFIRESEDDQKTLQEMEFPSKEAETDLFGRPDPVYDVVRETTKGAVGLPHGIHVIGRRWEEEKVLAGMKLLEELRDKNAIYQHYE